VTSVSAPERVADHLQDTPDGPLRVLHHTPQALYVEAAGRCVGVVAPSAAQVPCALRVSHPAVLEVADPSPYVVRGTLYLTGIPLQVGRFVDVRAPRIEVGRSPCQAASPAHAGERPPLPHEAGLAAPSPLPACLDQATVHHLVGRGPGLTPLGDDVLAGWLAVLWASGRLDDDTAATVRAALPRTTLLSATLLDCALHGEVLPEFAAYLSTVGGPSESVAVAALLRVGHTSGTGLWWGARHALDLLTREPAAA
jgi:hypothetical protein